MLKGKRILITGGSRGLGREMGIAFARLGAKIAFSYTRNEAAATETSTAISALGADVRMYKASVLDKVKTLEMISDIQGVWGGLDILVNNAGITQNLPLALMEEEDWDKVMDVNVKGTFLTTRAVIRTMIRQKKGVVLNIGSLAGMRPMDAPIHYCTSKAAIRGFTEALSKSVSRHNIRVLNLAPGLLEDGVGQNLPPHRLQDYLHHCSLGRVGTFAEVADFAAFLVSDQNTFMTGSTITMDGGL